MYVHPNCEFKTGDLVELLWDSATPRSYGLHIFLDNERPPHLKENVPIEFDDGPRFYKLYSLKKNEDMDNIEIYDRPYWVFRKA